MTPIDTGPQGSSLPPSPFFFFPLELANPGPASREQNSSKTRPGSPPWEGTHQTSLALRTRGRPSWVSDSHMEDGRNSGLCQAGACPAQQGGAGNAQELPVGGTIWAPAWHQCATKIVSWPFPPLGKRSGCWSDSQTGRAEKCRSAPKPASDVTCSLGQRGGCGEFG